jgi:alcohol dehydrogenase (NADP+)
MARIDAYAAFSSRDPLRPHVVERRDPGPTDVEIDILFCGICHSDIHQVRDEWGGSTYPMVPGHEIVGRVKRVGGSVTRLQVGDLVGVGCMVDSCRTCVECARHLEQFCLGGVAWTYNSTEMDRTTPTYGGYSTLVVVDEAFVLEVPESLDPAGAAPLLCAGITTYSPLRQWNCKKGDHVGVVGLGGLGHMAVKLAASMGADVTMLSTHKAKEADARRLGASGFALSTDETTFKKLAGRFDLLINTVSVPHDYNRYLGLVRPQGAMVVLGVPPQPIPLSAFSLISGNKRLAGSLIGGIAETQEMLDYCGAHGIVSDVEVIPAGRINEAYDRVVRGDVRYRFVIDVASLRTMQS